MPHPQPVNLNYLAMVQGVRDLHELLAAGLDDSPEAEAIRDVTDDLWESLSESERLLVRSLSEELYAQAPPD